MGGNIMIDGFPLPKPYWIEPFEDGRTTHHYAEIYSILSAVNRNAIGLYDSPIFYSPKQFCGSTRFFMDFGTSGIMNDVDILVDDHLFLDDKKLAKDACFTRPLNEINGFELAGIKNHGKQSSVLFSNGKITRQFDFVRTDYAIGEVHKFLHYADESDYVIKIKGVHHKLLLNSISRDYKFSITHGLKKRTDTNDWVGIQYPSMICKSLFGSDKKKDVEKMWSFRGLVDLFIKYKTGWFKGKNDTLYMINKFTDSCGNLKNVDSTFAINYLHRKFL